MPKPAIPCLVFGLLVAGCNATTSESSNSGDNNVKILYAMDSIGVEYSQSAFTHAGANFMATELCTSENRSISGESGVISLGDGRYRQTVSCE